jgi:hypothetical protein
MVTTATDRLAGISTSLAVKPPCKTVSTISLTLSGEQTVNAVSCADGDRVLLAISGGSVSNGIWVVREGAWERAKDFDGSRDVTNGTLVLVAPGTSSARFWEVTTSDVIVPGTTSIAFAPLDPTALSVDTTQVAHTSDDTGAVATTQHEVNSRTRSVLDFMTDAQRTAYKSRSGGASYLAANLASVQAAMAAAGNSGTVLFPEGRLVVAATIAMAYDKQTWNGAGRGSTEIEFAPTADDTLVEVGNLAGISNAQCIEGMTLTSGDSTYEKTAIAIYDTSNFVLRDVEITGTVVRGSTNTWSGGAGGSIGIRTYGREMPHIEGGCFISADNPIYISDNVHTTSPQIDLDFGTLRDLYMIAWGQPNILIGAAVEISNFAIEHCAMVRGTNAIKWLGSGSSRAPAGFAIRDCGWEQPESSSAYAIDIQPDQNLYGFMVDGLGLPDGAHGIRLTNAINPVFKRVRYGGGSGDTVLDLSSTVVAPRWEDCYWGVSTTVALSSHRKVWGMPLVLSTDPIPRTAQYDLTANTRYDLFHSGALSGAEVTIANDGTNTSVLGANANGLFSISIATATGTALYQVCGGTVSIANQIGTAFSTSVDTASKTNIYYTGGFYTIQNKTGASANYRVTFLGALGTFS